MKVCKASVGAVPERADSPAPGVADALVPGAADSLVPGAEDSLGPRAAASMPGIHGSKDSIEIKIKDSNILLKHITLARELNNIRKLCAPGVSQATEAALRSVWQPARLPTVPAGAKNVSAGTNTPRPPTPGVPLTKLLGRRGLTGTRLLLVLPTTKASTLRGSTSTNTITAATSTAAAAASTTPSATTEAPTPSTTPTSTATPSASSTASTAATTAPSTTLAPLALAVATPPTGGRRSPVLLSANEVDSSSRSNRGEKGDRGTPLKERGTRVAARSTYSNDTLLSCSEALL
ncbi:unnamed protein product [Closterium sp. NIES-54]